MLEKAERALHSPDKLRDFNVRMQLALERGEEDFALRGLEAVHLCLDASDRQLSGPGARREKRIESSLKQARRR